MMKNMGSTDRILRILATLVIIFLYVKGTISGTLGIVLMFFAAIFALTSFIRFCPLYLAFGLNSNKIREKK